jgi:hypothetical protein
MAYDPEADLSIATPDGSDLSIAWVRDGATISVGGDQPMDQPPCRITLNRTQLLEIAIYILREVLPVIAPDGFIELYRKHAAPDRPVVETLERMMADFERARDAAQQTCTNGIAECQFAITLINEARAERGLPSVGSGGSDESPAAAAAALMKAVDRWATDSAKTGDPTK